jgi:hypothetical protein
MARRRSVRVMVALAAAGCSSPSPSAGDGSQDAIVYASCTVPLADVTGRFCPASFDGTLASVECPVYREQHVYPCADTVVLLEGGGYVNWWCVYDSTSHALVGAKVTSDTNEYCNGQSFAEVAGRQADGACVAETPAAARLCPRPPFDAAPAGSPDDAADAAVSE